LEKDYLGVAERGRGRFRSFLLAALDHFLAKDWRRARARKRGGGRALLSLDFPGAEGRYSAEPAHDLTPEKLYERRWALALIDRVVGRLRDEFAGEGKLDLFERLKVYLGGSESAASYRQVAADQGMSEGAIKVAVHRLRRRCAELLRQEVARTVAGPQEVEEELRELFGVLG
jgi:RNA polymerase sigma-70 factor (ECF subfamily)